LIKERFAAAEARGFFAVAWTFRCGPATVSKIEVLIGVTSFRNFPLWCVFTSYTPFRKENDMQQDPNKTTDIKYAGGDSPSEERDQTERMPTSRIKLGAIATGLAFAVAIVVAVIALI